MKFPSRLGLVHASLAFFFLAIVGKAVKVQIIDGKAWSLRADGQQSTRREIPAPRGSVLDDSGRVLAQNQEKVRLNVTPRELRDRAKLERVLMQADVPARVIAELADTTLVNVTIPGVFLRIDVAPALGMTGVHSTMIVERMYTASQAARQIIGRVDVNGRATDGIELALDNVLKGKAGEATLIRDVRRRAFESPTAPGIAPVSGNSITLTINQELQEIAENALTEAVSKMGATSGDIVIVDPHTGEIRAMASRRGDNSQTMAALTDPFEPGSTMKPFIAAGLLERGLVKPTDSVDTGSGELVSNGWKITDEHALGRVPLADVIRMSSNIGIVKFAERLKPRDEFETLRDFGFGTATGVEFPSEAAGRLMDPTTWSLKSPSSMAMGYEVSVTPVQLALAYSVFANGGNLMEPTLVKEIRSPDGEVRYRHSPRVVRRVTSEAVALDIRKMLVEVVETGTGTDAGMDTYTLAGKTGTPRGTLNGLYIAGHNPNFVGLFPADDPQYVIVVRLFNPSGSYYGGKTAAPLTRAVIEAAVASPRAALDRARLAAVRQSAAPTPAPTGLKVASRADRAGETLVTPISDEPRAPEPVVVRLPYVRPARPAAVATLAVPDVRGMSLRDAVRTLHHAGFRVGYTSDKGALRPARATAPAAGSLVRSGTLVRLISF